MRWALVVFVLLAAPALADEPTLRPEIADDAHGNAMIQLAAERSRAEAVRTWNAVRAHSDTMLDGLEPNVTPVNVPGKGRFYRLRAGPTDADTAASICAGLKARGLDCIVVP